MLELYRSSIRKKDPWHIQKDQSDRCMLHLVRRYSQCSRHTFSFLAYTAFVVAAFISMTPPNIRLQMGGKKRRLEAPEPDIQTLQSAVCTLHHIQTIKNSDANCDCAKYILIPKWKFVKGVSHSGNGQTIERIKHSTKKKKKCDSDIFPLCSDSASIYAEWHESPGEWRSSSHPCIYT